MAWISKPKGASIVAFVTARKARGLKQIIMRHKPKGTRGPPLSKIMEDGQHATD
jgi:hypothetical protein